MTIGTRIANQMTASRSLAGIQSNQVRLARLQQQLSSGKVMTKPSDDPTAAQSALSLRAELARMTQFTRNADDGRAWLGTVDSTMQSMLAGVNRVRDIVVQGSSTGSMSANDRQALAAEVKGLRDSLIGDANATYLGRPVFGGTTSGKVAYNVTTGAYVGDNNIVTRTVGSTTAVRVDLTGPEAFGTPGSDLFALLGTIQNDLTGATGNLAADLTALDAVSQTMRSGLSDVGARYARLESVSATNDSRSIDMSASLSAVEDVDFAKTVLDLNVQQASYQAALQSTAKVIQSSLLDFLR
jgi:flagellar hook-associated protein 3 FlgL